MRRYAGRFGEDEAGHLLRRIAFAPAAGEVERAVDEGIEATVARMCAETPVACAEADALERELRDAGDAAALAGAWIFRMVATDEPLRERIALFFHGHFVSAFSKVGEGRMMLEQVALFRRRGPGSFADLTVAVARDPAMVRYLDSEKSSRSDPNENFARELLELFTTGPGFYSEHDIREAARAFTGWHLQAGAFRFSEAAHDPGMKTVLGTRGRFSGDDVARLCAEHPATPRFLAAKLAREFVADSPPPALVDAIAASWREHGGLVRVVLAELFRSEAFFAPEHRFALTRSPAALAAGLLRASGVRLAPLAAARHVAAMGQALLDPPGVKGWEPGRAWLNPASLIARRAFLAACAALVPDPRTAGSGVVERMLGTERASAVADAVRAAGARDDREALLLALMHPGVQRS